MVVIFILAQLRHACQADVAIVDILIFAICAKLGQIFPADIAAVIVVFISTLADAAIAEITPVVAVFIQTGYADIFHIGIHIVLRHGKGDDGTRHLIFRLGTVLLISPCQLAPEIAQSDEGDLRTGEQVQIVLIHAVDGAVHIGVHRQPMYILLIL